MLPLDSGVESPRALHSHSQRRFPSGQAQTEGGGEVIAIQRRKERTLRRGWKITRQSR